MLQVSLWHQTKSSIQPVSERPELGNSRGGAKVKELLASVVLAVYLLHHHSHQRVLTWTVAGVTSASVSLQRFVLSKACQDQERARQRRREVKKLE